jgi:hypothetical protein
MWQGPVLLGDCFRRIAGGGRNSSRCRSIPTSDRQHIGCSPSAVVYRCRMQVGQAGCCERRLVDMDGAGEGDSTVGWPPGHPRRQLGDAELETSAARLADALAEVAVTCWEYPPPIARASPTAAGLCPPRG